MSSPPHVVSSVTASIVVVSGREGEFRVQCRSTGGRALSMTVTGPGGYNSDLTNNIQPVTTTARRGNDTYSATTSDIITGGSNGDMYRCIVEGSTSNTDSAQLRGQDHTLSLYLIPTVIFVVATDPMIESLMRVVAGTVRVVWSQPTGGTAVRRCRIHYTDSSGSAWIKRVSVGSNSTKITGLTVGETYTFSVEATSIHLSGESEAMSITLGRSL